MQKTKIIFLGNGLLADFAKAELLRHENIEIVFHARGREDLEEVARIRREDPSVRAILASFGVIIKTDLLDLFEPEGILNIHPSLLPKYRGASPIESAILAGDAKFGVSVMKLAKGMDAGDIYWQKKYDVELNKNSIYETLATAGAKWVAKNIENLPEPVAQDDSQATFTQKIGKDLSVLNPGEKTAQEIFCQIIAAQNWPKPKWQFGGINCIILHAHIMKGEEDSRLKIECKDGAIIVDRLQPEGKRPMDAKSFANGYLRK